MPSSIPFSTDVLETSTDWRVMLASLQTELTSRGGSGDLTEGIRMVLERSEEERMRYRAQYEALLRQLHDLGPKVAEARKISQEVLAERNKELQELRLELEGRRQLMRDTNEALTQARTRISLLMQEVVHYRDEAADFKDMLEMRDAEMQDANES